jgi:hypothetical protein
MRKATIAEGVLKRALLWGQRAPSLGLGAEPHCSERREGRGAEFGEIGAGGGSGLGRRWRRAGRSGGARWPRGAGGGGGDCGGAAGPGRAL